MLIDYYGFREHPFQMTPDPRMFYPSSVHSRAYAHLLYGLAQREGFVVVTGEVGAGKTTLIERLCGELDPAGFAIARISTTQVSGDDLLALVADAFGAPAEGPKATILRGIIAALRAGADGARRHLLIVDEAQALPPAALEELRMLSNVTDDGRALLQTLLLGQPQLRRLMASPDLDQLRQRVLASYHLGGLSREETHAYVEHRLRAVGWDGRPAWEEAALDLVHRHSGGIPRRINRLCSRVLLGGALEQTDELTVPLVEATARELEEDLSGGQLPSADSPGSARLPAVLGAAQAPASFGETVAAVAALSGLAQRIDALERVVARRERVFNRLIGLFAERGAGGDR
jgi:putative secretion ATPase (PEP-CTERM system associated)